MPAKGKRGTFAQAYTDIEQATDILVGAYGRLVGLGESPHTLKIVKAAVEAAVAANQEVNG